MNGRLASRLLGLLGGALALASADASQAQSVVRISGSTSVRYLEVRPLVRDSVSVDETEGNALLRQTREGRVVRCVPGDAFCRGTRPGDPVSTLPVIQDLEVSAWGFGEGLRLFAQLRGRTAWGGNRDFWPRAEEAFDLLAAYGELDRERFRVRAGRQWKVSGLGFYNFDGLALALRPGAGVSVEGYAGRSLVRGLNEPRTGGALEAIEALAPEQPGVLLGVQARYRPAPRLAFGAFYQREIREDRGALYSELAAADAVLRAGGGSLEGSLELDVAAGSLNDARLALRAPPLRRIALLGEVRRYRPYFELWTIWGAFSPVGFDEARLALTRAGAGGDLILRGEASYRRYDDIGDGIDDFRSEGWGAGANASWSPRPPWRVEAGYRVEVGFGAARSDGHVGVVRQLGELGSVAVRGMAFQRLYEFRLEEGTVLGLGAETSLRLSERSRVFAGVTGYRHLDARATADPDWTQLRGSLRLLWTVGAEPGIARRGGGS